MGPSDTPPWYSITAELEIAALQLGLTSEAFGSLFKRRVNYGISTSGMAEDVDILLSYINWTLPRQLHVVSKAIARPSP